MHPASSTEWCSASSQRQIENSSGPAVGAVCDVKVIIPVGSCGRHFFCYCLLGTPLYYWTLYPSNTSDVRRVELEPVPVGTCAREKDDTVAQRSAAQSVENTATTPADGLFLLPLRNMASLAPPPAPIGPELLLRAGPDTRKEVSDRQPKNLEVHEGDWSPRSSCRSIAARFVFPVDFRGLLLLI